MMHHERAISKKESSTYSPKELSELRQQIHQSRVLRAKMAQLASELYRAVTKVQDWRRAQGLQNAMVVDPRIYLDNPRATSGSVHGGGDENFLLPPTSKPNHRV
jgi:hypothetical protein